MHVHQSDENGPPPYSGLISPLKIDLSLSLARSRSLSLPSLQQGPSVVAFLQKPGRRRVSIFPAALLPGFLLLLLLCLLLLKL